MSPLLKNQMYSFLKRLIDLFISIFSIVFLSPILIPISIILRFSGEGEILFLQKRVGLKNKEFNLYKFATMLKDSPNLGSGIYTAKNDSRILPFGHFLRKSKINELPQLVNIILGDLSLVGPRPLIKKTFDLYEEKDRLEISSVKPGLTGVGSIIFRNEEEILENAKVQDLENFYKNKITPYKASVEKWYVKNRSTKVDLIIIFLTAWAIIFKKSELIFRIFKDLPKLNF